MEFSVESKISNFIENQFPSFYKEEGPNFILFVKAYYEWLEQENNPIYGSRNLLNFRDVDNTLQEFLSYFQKKYVFGIPPEVIINKRFLIKHILDIYRSKSTIQGYKLLFRILYNEDIEIYLPGIDILRVSDGTWKTPKYLEVTQVENFSDYIGKEIQGYFSGTTAIVENITKETYYTDIINTIFISNILPKGADFIPGEKIVLKEDIDNGILYNVNPLESYPTLLGSLNSLTILSGGQGFKVGNIIKIAKRDDNNNVISYGQNGYLRVKSLAKQYGTINFDIYNGGFGFLANSMTFVYNNNDSGSGASFKVGAISDTKSITYNTDVICNYANLAINATSYGFPANSSGNVSSTIANTLTFQTSVFGKILSLNNIEIGNNYSNAAYTFVRSTLLSNALVGSVSFNTTSNTVTGTSTIFDQIFANGDIIGLRANSSLSSSEKYYVIKQVVSNTSILLYGPPSINSTASAQYKAAPVILPSNFALYEDVMYRTDGTINGQNEIIQAFPFSGNSGILEVDVIDSGKGFIEAEQVKAYLFGAINTPTIENAGVLYSNGDLLVFSGGGTTSAANGFVTTNNSGSIVSTTISDYGSGYITQPNIRVKSINGTGAVLSTTLSEFNKFSTVIGKVKKAGIGIGRGYWSTTRGFLNSDKYIQDSYYYQDYSYEIKVNKTLDKYKDVIYNSFHITGTELFGRFLSIDKVDSIISIAYSNNTPEIS